MRHQANIKLLASAMCWAFWASGCTQSISTGLPTMAPPPTVPAPILPTTLPSGFPAVVQINATRATTPTTVAALTVPINTPVPLPPPPAPTQAQSQQTGVERDRIKIFLVAPNDNGKTGPKIGCNDSLVAVEREIKPTQAVLTASLNELFSLKTQNYGQSGLITALYQSNIQLKSAQVINGRMTVHLSGTPKYGGTCDVPRFKEQISATIRQFSTTNNALIYVNDVLIENLK